MKFSYVKNELTKRGKRSMFVISSIALSIAVLIAVNSLANAFVGATEKPLKELGTDIIVQRSGDTPEDFLGASLPCSQVIITSEEVSNVKNVSSIKQVSTALLLWVFENENFNDIENFKIVTGIDTYQTLGASKVNDWIVKGTKINSGDKGIALVDSSYANLNNIDVNDTISISGYSFQVTGIVEIPPNSLISASNIYVSLEDAQDIAVQSKNIPDYKIGDVNQIFLQSDSGDISEVIKEIQEVVPQTSVTSAESFMKAVGGVAAQSRNIAVLGSIVILLFSLIVVSKTISGNIMERKNEIGIMKTVGWTSKDIYRQIISETFVQSIIGGIIGIGIGFLVAMILGNLQINIPVAWEVDPFPHFLMTDTTEQAMNVGLPVVISLKLIGLAFVVSIIIGIISAFLTLRNINKIKPSEVLRYE